MVRRRFRVADTAQQLVGGFLLAGPFVVTEEVWRLAESMSVWQTVLAVGIVAGIGYGALYKADATRDPDREAEIAGVPTRFVSLLGVAFGSVFVLAMVFNAPATFVEGDPWVTAKAVAVGAVFSVVGAATADSVF